MNILVTGAAGLLGQCVMRELAGRHTTTGTCHTNTCPGLVPMAIDDPVSVRRTVQTTRLDCIVNCAGLRSPEYCLEHPDQAYQVNGLAVEYLARAANETGATLLHVSTDYVFDGTQPPYREDAAHHPVNCYGRSKLAGEHAARSAHRHLILRIPALWRTDYTDPRNVASEIIRRLRSGETLAMDSVTVRYYTLADDVAAAIRFCIDHQILGTLHVTAGQKTSKADFARRLALSMGLSGSRVIDAPLPTTGDARPLDSHFSAAKYQALGGPRFLGVDEALAAACSR